LGKTAKPPQGGFFIFDDVFSAAVAQPLSLRGGVRCEPSLEA
jgi:hypothetical protein